MVAFRWSERMRWAREELNLRPLPCQIQRAPTDMYFGWLEIGKDYRNAAGDRSYGCPSAPTIHHDSPTVMLVPTKAGCCPSAAPTHQAQPLGPQSESPACVIPAA